jgi:hypothetical protein
MPQTIARAAETRRGIEVVALAVYAWQRSTLTMHGSAMAHMRMNNLYTFLKKRFGGFACGSLAKRIVAHHMVQRTAMLDLSDHNPAVVVFDLWTKLHSLCKSLRATARANGRLPPRPGRKRGRPRTIVIAAPLSK